MSGITLKERRRSGKTTSIILDAVSRAVGDPGKRIEVIDHFKSDSYVKTQTIKKMTQEIVNKLHLNKVEVFERSGKIYVMSSWYGCHEGSDGGLYIREE